MTFKQNWEKADQQHKLPDNLVSEIVLKIYPEKKLKSYQIISGGCANLNLKLTFKNEDEPLLLRIYLRDSTAAAREKELAELLHKTLPVPQIYIFGKIYNYQFSLSKWVYGITLRDLLLGSEPYDQEDVMYAVGKILAHIGRKKFDKSGFFDENLKVLEPTEEDSYLSFVKSCLLNEVVKNSIDKNLLLRIKESFEKFGYLLPDNEAKSLVHGDFDPANILVSKGTGSDWRVSAVLDWEFSFSGSPLCDVANMLRYSHHMPKEYEASFLEGYQSEGNILPKHWRITVHLLNLISLLDCLRRSDKKNRPQQYFDICELLEYIQSELEKKL